MVVFSLCMTFLLKLIKYMDTISIVYLYNDLILKKMSIKPSQFNLHFMSLYPRDITWQIMILIVGRPCVFPYNDDNVVFTGISCMIYITCFKMDDGVLAFLQLGLIHIPLCLQCHLLIFDGVYLIVSALQIITEQCNCCIFFFYGLLMFFLYFVCKLLPSLWKHHITAVPSEFFCHGQLTGKQQLIYSFLN